MRLSDHVALVSGGASGIGRAIVERLVADGAAVMIADIAVSAAEDLAGRLGRGARCTALDVTQDGQWASAIGRTEEAFGPLTCLVNNAGISLAGSITSTDEASWRRTLDVNATGTFLGCKHAVAAMSRSWVAGAIVNIGSARGQRTSSAQIAYCASKALVQSLTESVALACGEQGLPIRCNLICPGVIDTPILDQVRDQLGGREQADAVLGRLSLVGRLGQPEEIAAAAAFLVSDEARFITGTAINVDGGFRIRDR